MRNDPVHLISRWPLKCGMTDELHDALLALVEAIQENEPGTLSYQVFVGAYEIAPGMRVVGALPHDQQQDVTFEETYADRSAFEAHVDGDDFQDFRRAQLDHFFEDPKRPGWPTMVTTFLERIAGIRR